MTASSTLSAGGHALLPTEEPLRLLDADSVWSECDGLVPPSAEELVALHRAMVIGRRFDAQAGSLVKQGRLAVYPSSRGQDACVINGNGADLHFAPDGRPGETGADE